MATVAGRTSTAEPQITTAALRALDEPTDVGCEMEIAPPERRSIDEMNELRRPAPKTIANERALQFHEDTSTQRIEMMCDAAATDPNA